jgi:hypothetical protein
MRLFGVMYMESGAATGVRFGDDERERLEAILIAVKPVCEFARHTVPMLQLAKREKES